MAQQRMMDVRNGGRRGRKGGRNGGRSRSNSRDRRREQMPKPPKGPWMNGGCDGEKISTYKPGQGVKVPFSMGEEWCQKESQNFKERDLCCRCDNGDGVMTDRCWLQAGGMEDDKDFAFMVRGEMGNKMGRGDGPDRNRRGDGPGNGPDPREAMKMADADYNGELNRDELRVFAEMMGKGDANDKDLEEAMNKFDYNKNGQLDEKELS